MYLFYFGDTVKPCSHVWKLVRGAAGLPVLSDFWCLSMYRFSAPRLLKDKETTGGSLPRGRGAKPGSVGIFIKGSVISRQGRWAKGETCNN